MRLEFKIPIEELEKIYPELKNKLKVDRKKLWIGLLDKSKEEIYKIIRRIDYPASEREFNWMWGSNKIIVGAYLDKKPVGLLWMFLHKGRQGIYYFIKVKRGVRNKGIGTALEIFSFVLLKYLYNSGEVKTIFVFNPNERTQERFEEYGWPPQWNRVTPVKVEDAFAWMRGSLNLKELDEYLESKED